MASLQQFYDLRYNRPALRERVTGAILVAAWAVLNEGTTETKRRAWARGALADPASQALKVLPAVIANSAVRNAELAQADSSKDADIQAVVNGQIDVLAGL